MVLVKDDPILLDLVKCFPLVLYSDHVVLVFSAEKTYQRTIR